MTPKASDIIAKSAIKSQGQVLSPRDKIVPRKFKLAFEAIHPCKSAAHLAALGGVDERTGKRWLRGEIIPPGDVVTKFVAELFEPIE